MSSRNRHHSIRNPGSFRPGASRNARGVSNGLENLVTKKKDSVIQLMKDLKHSGVITNFRITRNSRRAVYFEVDIVKENINKKNIELQFIIWTDNTKPNNWTKSNSAGFFLRVYEDIEKELLDYLEGIERGLTTEYLGIAVLERLQRAPLQERKFRYFRKATPDEDRYGRKDVVVIIVHDGREIEAPIQFKSSEKELMKHKENFGDVSGWFRVFTGNREKDMDIIEEKTIKIIDAYKENKIIFI